MGPIREMMLKIVLSCQCFHSVDFRIDALLIRKSPVARETKMADDVLSVCQETT